MALVANTASRIRSPCAVDVIAAYQPDARAIESADFDRGIPHHSKHALEVKTRIYGLCDFHHCAIKANEAVRFVGYAFFDGAEQRAGVHKCCGVTYIDGLTWRAHRGGEPLLLSWRC